jgi:microcystin-dependent protein
MPIGSIIMWSGTSIPTGWALCDGNNGTPNLLNKFIRGTDLDGVGATGGSDDAVVVSHGHSFTGTAMGTHKHTSLIKTTVWGRGEYTDLSNSTEGDTSSDSAGTPSGTISTEGVDGTGKNIPAYYALCYIMKIS